MSRNKIWLISAAWGLALAISSASLALAFVIYIPSPIPIERLIKTASRAVAENPNSASKHYELARLHYLIFSRGLMTMEPDELKYAPGFWRENQSIEWLRHSRARELAYDDIGLDGGIVPRELSAAYGRALDRRVSQLERDNWKPATSLSVRTMSDHAEKAFVELGIAALLEPSNVHYALSRTCVADQFVSWSREVKLTRVAQVFRDLDMARVGAMYLGVFRLGTETAGSIRTPDELHKISTYEAGIRFLRLVDQQSAAARLGAELEHARPEVAAGLEKIRDWPTQEVVTLVTPIVLSLQSDATLEAIVDATARMDFDLRGFGPRGRWPWIRPDTGLLVWDPEKTASITSGRQLFGGYTFQIFRANGYDALAALDDDGDGFLRGAELDGIRVWFDRNSDGRSTPDEVVDLAALSIIGIAVHATGSEGIHPTNSAGVIFSDGRTLPTWDWMVAPHRN